MARVVRIRSAFFELAFRRELPDRSAVLALRTDDLARRFVRRMVGDATALATVRAFLRRDVDLHAEREDHEVLERLALLIRSGHVVVIEREREHLVSMFDHEEVTAPSVARVEERVDKTWIA